MERGAERILITGGSGFIGTALARRLSEQGHSLALLSRRPPVSAIANTEFHSIDLCDAQATQCVVQAFAPTLCFHLAACPDGAESHDRAHQIIETNIGGTLNLLEALRLSGNCRLVYGCSVKVHGNGPAPYGADQLCEPNSSYAVAKAAAWEFANLYRRVHAMPVVAIRPTLVYGPGQGLNLISFMISKLRDRAKYVELQGGNQTRAPLFIDDAVDAFCMAGEALLRNPDLSGHALPVGGDEEVKVIDIAKKMIELSGQSMRAIVVEGKMRPTEIFRSACDNGPARHWLDWTPRNSLEQGLAKTMQSIDCGLVAPARALSA